MKRPIKFRIWDDILKVLFTPELDAKIGNLWTMPILSGGVLKDREGIEVMQFTGLTDKNGKEIYEGDVIALDDVICPITFSNGSFQMVTSENQGSSNAIQERVKYFEVIGNIYQNPELITQ